MAGGRGLRTQMEPVCLPGLLTGHVTWGRYLSPRAPTPSSVKRYCSEHRAQRTAARGSLLSPVRSVLAVGNRSASPNGLRVQNELGHIVRLGGGQGSSLPHHRAHAASLGPCLLSHACQLRPQTRVNSSRLPVHMGKRPPECVPEACRATPEALRRSLHTSPHAPLVPAGCHQPFAEHCHVGSSRSRLA